MDSTFIKLPAQFKNDRIFLYPTTENGVQLELYTDTGGGGMLIPPDVVRHLNLQVFKKEIENGEEVQYVTFPKFRDEAMIPTGEKSNALFLYSDPLFEPGQGLLGQSWFADRVWFLDYQNREMGYNNKGISYDTTGFQSAPIGFKHDDDGVRQISFPRIQAKIDGEVMDFLFDTGATVHLTDSALETLDKGDASLQGTSFITQYTFEKWRGQHPDWPVIEQADRLGIEHPDRLGNGAMIQVPSIEVAGLKSGPVWFTLRPNSNFRDRMSQMMDRRIEGALGGSAFKYFTIIIDYPNSMAHFKR